MPKKREGKWEQPAPSINFLGTKMVDIILVLILIY